MSIEDFKNKVEKLERKIDKEDKEESFWVFKNLLIVVITIVFVSLGYRFFNPINKSIQKIVSKNGINEELNGIKILSVKDNKILISKTDKDKKEIKLINTETGVINDISQGDIKANTAILSNSGDSIVYSSSSKDSTSLYMITMETNNSKIIKIFDSKNIDYDYNTPCKKIESDYFKMCRWSTIEWSPSDDKISFFTCSENMSFLIIIDINNNIKSNIIRDTIICNSLKREHKWLNNEDIVFSTNNNLSSISSKNSISSKSVYGNFFK